MVIQGTARVNVLPPGGEPSDLLLLYEADTLPTLGLTHGDPVGTWPDLSGRGVHLTQPLAGRRPWLTLSSINGRPAVDFDGNDLLSAPFTGLSGIGQPFTLIVAGSVRGEGTTSTFAALSRSGASTNPVHELSRSVDGQFRSARRDDSGTLRAVTSQTVLPLLSWAVITLTFNGVRSSIRSNGIGVADGLQEVGNLTLDRFVVGSVRAETNSPTAYLRGRIYGLALYRGALPAEPRAAAENYFRAKLAL